ncbi:MAG TPA: hypothetical protein VFD60_11660 [Nitrososphaeraceae archaeon]|nr:hypothetical protein [Nitrososphaeraceae archaeon]
MTGGIKIGHTMADEIFMFAVTAGTMAALAALLFISRGRRTRSRSAEIRENVPSSSSSSTSSSSSKKNQSENGKKAKKYTSDGKPVYD